MIDEKKLIEDIKAECEKNSAGGLYVNEIIGVIHSQPKVREWIPVSERLPKEGERIIGTFTNGKGKWFVCEEQFFLFLLEGPYPLIAWMPLPEPYKGE